jgi:hypothetical protein
MIDKTIMNIKIRAPIVIPVTMLRSTDTRVNTLIRSRICCSDTPPILRRPIESHTWARACARRTSYAPTTRRTMGILTGIFGLNATERVSGHHGGS